MPRFQIAVVHAQNDLWPFLRKYLARVKLKGSSPAQFHSPAEEALHLGIGHWPATVPDPGTFFEINRIERNTSPAPCGCCAAELSPPILFQPLVRPLSAHDSPMQILIGGALSRFASAHEDNNLPHRLDEAESD